MVLKEFDTITSLYGAAGISLSEEGDLLSQWRAYSENGGGVSIGFDSAAFTGDAALALPIIGRIEYDLATQKRIIAPNMDQICNLFKSGSDVSKYDDVEMPDGIKVQVNKDLTLNMSMVTLLPLLYAFKNPAFREEKEWRGGKILGMLAAPDVEEADGWFLHKMEYRALGDRIVPYRSFPLDVETGVIREVILGPRNITPIRIAKECLSRYGWKNVSVRKSTASYR